MMQPALVNATPSDPLVEAPATVLAAYHDHQKMTGRGNTSFTRAARAFLCRWPAPRTWEDETLVVQLSANPSTRPFITFLLVTGRIHPGLEYLVHRKFSSIWRDVPGTHIGADLQEFITAAGSCGYSQPVASAMASQGGLVVRVVVGARPSARCDHLIGSAIAEGWLQSAVAMQDRGVVVVHQAPRREQVRAHREVVLDRHLDGCSLLADDCRAEVRHVAEDRIDAPHAACLSAEPLKAGLGGRRLRAHAVLALDGARWRFGSPPGVQAPSGLVSAGRLQLGEWLCVRSLLQVHRAHQAGCPDSSEHH